MAPFSFSFVGNKCYFGSYQLSCLISTDVPDVKSDFLFVPEMKGELEELMADIKKTANKVRGKLKCTTALFDKYR